jgi:hypothetical protein
MKKVLINIQAEINTDRAYLETDENYNEYIEYIANMIDKNFKENKFYFPYVIEGLGDIKLIIELESYIDECWNVDEIALCATFTLDKDYESDYILKIIQSNTKLQNFIVDKMNELIDNFNNTVNIKLPKMDCLYYNNNFYIKADLSCKQIFIDTINLEIKKDKITTDNIIENIHIYNL